MNKQDFLADLKGRLSGLPRDDVEERLNFYTEMIDDRMEDGLSEEEAVAAVGPAEKIVSQIVEEIPLPKLVKERIRPKRRLRAWEIILLVLGSPVWIPLLIAVFALFLSLYIVLWALLISLWAVEVSLIAGALGAVGGGVLLTSRGEPAQGLLWFSAAAVLAGLSIFLFFGCRQASKGTLVLTKKIALWTKSMFLRKENEK